MKGLTILKNKFNLDTVFKIIWISLCLLWCGWFLVKIIDSTYFLWEKIFFALGLLVLFAICLSTKKELEKYEEFKSDLSPTLKHFYHHQRYICNTYFDIPGEYENYLIMASSDKVLKDFIPILENGINYSIQQLKENKNSINNLFSLWISKKDILNNWENYNGKKLCILCFFHYPSTTLSVLPFEKGLYIEYNHETYFSSDFSIYFDRFSSHLDENLVKSISDNPQVKPFVTITGCLSIDSSNKFFLKNCDIELADFQAYRQEITPKK